MWCALDTRSHGYTKMSNKLLCDLHPLQQLLKEPVSKALLNGGNLLLHVLQSSGGQNKSVRGVSPEAEF